MNMQAPVQMEENPVDGHKSIDHTFATLYTTFTSGRTRSLEWRSKQLDALNQCLDEQEASLISALNADLGKGDYEAWATEIGFVKSEIKFALKHLKRWTAKRKVATPIVAQPSKSYLLAEPLGVVLIIGAWNYPVQLVLGPLVAAIAAGNCAVIKPSELSPQCSSTLAQILPKYMDQEAIAVVEGAVPETTELLSKPFDHVLYTGGEAVAKIVMRAASENLTPVTLELGGKSPCIVDATADLDVAAARIAWSKWMNAGQTCVATDYVLVEESVADDFLTSLKATIKRFYGDDAKQSKDLGRIVNQRHFARLHNYLGQQEQARIVHGGDFDAEQQYMGPTLVLNPSMESDLMQDEIFGPILPIITVKEKIEAIDLINAKSKPLAMYLYTTDDDYEQQVLASVSAGSVAINEGMMFMANPHLPFGGVGNSGMGRYHGQYGFDTFSHLKAVLKRGTKLDHALRYPPFSKFKLWVIKKLL